MIAVYIVVACLLIGVLAGKVAETHGRSFWVYFVGCTVLPLAGFIAVPYILIDSRLRRPRGLAV